MTDIALGPFIFSAERLSWILAILTLWTGSGIGARKGLPHLRDWTFYAVVTGFVSARIAFVATHAGDYAVDPWTVLAFWQGGFATWGAVIGFGGMTLFYLRKHKAILPWIAGLTIAAGLVLYVTTLLFAAPERYLRRDLALQDLAGRSVTLQGPAVINLWASWCPPCRREMPMMIAEAAANPDLPMYFVNQGEGADTIRRYLSRDNLVMSPVLDPAMGMMGELGILGLPATLFINANSRVVEAHTGEISRAALRRSMKDLAGE